MTSAPALPRTAFRTLVPLGTAALLAVLTACTSVQLDKSKLPGSDRAATASGAAQNDGGVSNVAPVTTPAETDPLNDPNSPLAKRSVYFQFDSFVVQPDDQSVVEDHARYLTSHRNRKVMIEGNTDESGSREYNLALGQKRADAVRRALATLGVDDNQMEAISLGEEKPRASGSDEQSMSENRRADLNYR